MRDFIQRARRGLQLAFSALVLVAAGRFAWTAVTLWRARESPEAAAQVAVARPEAKKPAPQGQGEPPPAQVGDLISAVLSVSHGSRRSEVLVDEMPVGHTTFVGDVSCRSGSDVTIRIVPKRGRPSEHVRRCDGTMMVVTEP